MYQTVNKCKKIQNDAKENIYSFKELNILYDELIYDLLYNENDQDDQDQLLETIRVIDEAIKWYFYNQKGWFKKKPFYIN